MKRFQDVWRNGHTLQYLYALLVSIDYGHDRLEELVAYRMAQSDRF